MNRRTFFKGVAALCCAPLIPVLPRKKSRLFYVPIAINLDGTYWPYDEESLKALSIPLREVIFTKEKLEGIITWT